MDCEMEDHQPPVWEEITKAENTDLACVGEVEEEAPRPSPYEEVSQVIRLENEFWGSRHPREAVCYALDFGWWQRWCAYTGFKLQPGNKTTIEEPSTASPPGDIDNSRMASSAIFDFQERIDFTCKSPKTWQYFCQLYPGSGPEVALSVTPDGKVKLPRTFSLHRSSDLQAKPLRVSLREESTISDLKAAACEMFRLEEVDVQLWDYFNNRKHSDEHLETDPDKTILDCNLIDNQDILLQEKVDGKFPRNDKDTSSSDTYIPAYGFNRYNAAPPTDTVTQQEGAKAGTAGLSNLGNTCFMNSSLQCLAHTVPLVRTFLSDAYKADINRDNPLGNGGKLAEAFGEVLKKLWEENAGVVTPRHFKQQLASFHSHFAGYNQHDSQELLAFLMDGLHEDLNRVKDKPYIEIPDSNGRPDEELADEGWRIYKARNDSYIADHFQGMYKSTLVCPKCHYSSVKMETFNCLSLPLPSAKMRDVEVTVVSMDGSSPPTHYTVQLLKLGTVKDLYAGIAKLSGLDCEKPEELLLLVETCDGRIRQKFVEMKEPLADAIRNNMTLLAYKYSSREHGPASGGKETHIFQRRKRKKRSFYTNHDVELFAAPLLLFIPENQTETTEQTSMAFYDTLLKPNGPFSTAVEAALSPFKRRKTQQVTTPGLVDNAPLVEEDMPTLPSSTALELDEQMPSLFPESIPQTADSHPAESNFADRARLLQGALDSVGISGGYAAPRASSSVAADASPPETPELGPSLCTSPVTTPRLNSMGSDSSQTTPIVAFDMFELQQPWGEPPAPEQAPIAGSEDDSAPPPYQIHVTNFLGGNASSQLGLTNNELYFAIDWDPSAVREYDPECMESPCLHSSTQAARAKRDAGPKPFTLQECLEAFLEGERLEDSESWCCKECKEKVQAHKKLDLWDLPEVAVIHLKRFSYSHRFRDKIDRLVQFPLHDLNLQSATLKKQDTEPLYDLFAVSNHFGGLGGGHYTAYAKVNDTGDWYCFDDSHTYPVSAESVITPAAYVLFYRRQKESRADQGKTHTELVKTSRDQSEWSDVDSAEGTLGKPDPVRELQEQQASLEDHPMDSLPGSPQVRTRPMNATVQALANASSSPSIGHDIATYDYNYLQ